MKLRLQALQMPNAQFDFREADPRDSVRPLAGLVWIVLQCDERFDVAHRKAKIPSMAYESDSLKCFIVVNASVPLSAPGSRKHAGAFVVANGRNLHPRQPRHLSDQ